MRKLKLLLMACALFGAGTAWAQTDVTSTYLTNADFEGTYTTPYHPNNDRDITQPNGWTLTYSNGVQYDSSILKETQATYSNISGQVTIPGDGRGYQTYAVRFHNNGNKQLITLAQEEKTFAKGKYTLSGLFRSQNQNELEIGFYFGTYSTDTRKKYDKGNGSWQTFSTTFESDGTYKTTIGLFFKHTSGNQMVAGVDNITLMYENVDVDLLNNLIIKANGINAKLNNSTLATVIASSQEAYNGINDTPAYQETIDNAISSLQEAISTAISGYNYNPAGDDVSWLIANNGFESSEASTGDVGTSTRVNYASSGWTLTSEGGNSASAVLAYGVEGNKINGAAIPANDDANNTGNALGISVGWSTTIAYQSTLPITLPAGSYVLKVNAYNAGTATLFNSKFGFVPTSGGAPSLSSKTSFTLNTWETDEISFTLTESTEGKIQIGGTASNNTSGNHGKVFFDNITLTYFDPLKLAQIQWQEVHDALAALDATALPDAAETAITTELAKSVPTTTPADVNSAKDALQALIDSYDGIKAAYDKVNALIVLATNEKTNSTGEKDDIESAISTVTTNIETRTTADDLTSDHNTLETARQAYVTGGAQPIADHVFDFTFKIADAAVTGTGWSASGTANGEQYTGAPDNKYFDCGWNSSLNKNQTVASLPAGYYTMKAATRAKSTEVTSANIYVNQTRSELNRSTDNHRDGNIGGDLGNGWSWTEVDFELRADGNVTVGFYAQTTNQGWAGADDFHLYYKGNAVDDVTAEALKATVVTGKMNSTVSSNQTSALSAFESAQTIENYEALEVAIAAARASVEAYTKLNTELGKVIEAISTTNVYTKAALNDNYVSVQGGYRLGSISDEVANAYQYGERVTGAMPAIMLSAWTVGETSALTNGSLYMNTWSTEGNSDGSEMATPFYEYWTSDANALDAKTFTATISSENLPSGATFPTITAGQSYVVSALVRVRQQDSQTKADDDVTMQVNDGEIVNAADGTQSAIRPEMYYKVVRATGTADNDGKLTIKFVVKEGNHINWLSFKDVIYTPNTEATDDEKSALQSVITIAEEKVVGFNEGEYAPYTNVAARKALVAAKTINDDIDSYTSMEVKAATVLLTNAQWDVNEEEMNAVSPELFNNVEYGAAGWTRTQTWNNTNVGVYSVPAGTMTYGDVAYYEMPLEENTVYKLTFGHRKWDSSNSDNGGKVSVLNGSGEGLALASFNGTNIIESLVEEAYFFRTGEAGNYTFSISAESGRLTFGDVTILKAEAESVTISENDEAAPVHKYANVTLDRAKLSRQYWNTFSVPFDAPIPGDWTVKEFDKVEGSTMYFKEASSFVAGKPYIVKLPDEDMSNIVFNNVIVKATEGEQVGTGDYKFAAQIYNKPLDASNGTIAYLSTSGSIKKLSEGGSIKGLRAYFIIPATGEGARIAFTDGEQTGITEMQTESLKNIDGMYDMSGRRVQTMKKGIYVVNGKKVIK